MMEKKIYSSKYAEDCYRETLSSSREGINQTPESIQKMNDILTPLIQKGQSISHIYATHAEELGCSKRTAYAYIDAGVFDVRNIDLRRKVKYKKRRQSTRTSAKNRAYRIGHNYEDFQQYMKEHPEVWDVIGILCEKYSTIHGSEAVGITQMAYDEINDCVYFAYRNNAPGGTNLPKSGIYSYSVATGDVTCLVEGVEAYGVAVNNTPAKLF